MCPPHSCRLGHWGSTENNKEEESKWHVFLQLIPSGRRSSHLFYCVKNIAGGRQMGVGVGVLVRIPMWARWNSARLRTVTANRRQHSQTESTFKYSQSGRHRGSDSIHIYSEIPSPWYPCTGVLHLSCLTWGWTVLLNLNCGTCLFLTHTVNCIVFLKNSALVEWLFRVYFYSDSNKKSANGKYTLCINKPCVKGWVLLKM